MTKRYNYELYEIFNESNIVNYIKVNRLARTGHLVCMNNDKTIKKIFNTKPDGARSVGRPKLRWEDGVDQDLRSTISHTGCSASRGRKARNWTPIPPQKKI